MVQQSVQKRRCQHIVTEQFSPAAEILVAGQDDAAMLISLGNQTEEQLRLLTAQLAVSNLVNHQHYRPQIHPPPAVQMPLGLCFFQILN